MAQARRQTPPRARAAHLGPERRRPLVLDAAFDVFLDQGYDGASMDAVARQAGVSKPVVYACFASKDELFTALLVREERRILAEVAAAIPGDPGADLERVLVDGLTALLTSVARAPQAFRLIFLGEGGSGAVAERVQRGRQAQVDALGSFLEDWLDQRKTRDAEQTATLMAYALVGAAEGAARALLADPDGFKPEVAGPLLGRLIARGALAT